MTTRTIVLDVADISDGDTLNIKLRFGTAEPAEPKPEPKPDAAVANVLARFHARSDAATIDTWWTGLRKLGFTPSTAHTTQPKPPPYIRWTRPDGLVIGTANTGSFTVTRRAVEYDAGQRKAILAVPGAYRRTGDAYLPMRTVAEAETVLAVLRPLGAS
jgi:hypothetical protein